MSWGKSELYMKTQGEGAMSTTLATLLLYQHGRHMSLHYAWKLTNTMFQVLDDFLVTVSGDVFVPQS